MKPEVIAKRKQRKKPRSRERLNLEILKIVEKKKEIKRTEIANSVQINYILATELTDKLENNKLIKREENGEYAITEQGKIAMEWMKKLEME
jgi:predicted transcriptional regulator